MSGSELIPLVATIVGLGVVAQVLADKYRVPSVLFLLLAGILAGPEVAGLVDPEAFGNALSAIVGLSVAIIVFEGAFHLKLSKLRQSPQETLRLVTVGAVLSLVATAAVVHVLLGAPLDLSFLIGALLVATGPTVITPILEVVPVRDRVSAALETEGVVNDVTAAILAVIAFEVVHGGSTSIRGVIIEFSTRLGVGIAVGLVLAGVVWYVLNHIDLSAGGAPQNARMIVLASALVAYGAADWMLSEAGIAAVATAGIVLGNANLPYEEDIESFKGDITLIVLSFVFVTLAALLSIDDLLRLGIAGLLIAVLVAVVIRPIVVYLSTTGNRFTFSERAFMSAVAPRGIIPASVATLFAVQLQSSQPAAANTLVGVVFLVIVFTVVLEGGPARQIAEFLDVIPMRVIIIGGGTVGRELAERLEDRGENVVIIEREKSMVEVARNEGFTVHEGDGTDTEVLRSAGAENAKIMVAATGDDDANLLVSQLADTKFDVETIIARANNPDNVAAFEDLGVRTVSSAMATAWGIDNLIERPALATWMTELGRSGDVQEIAITNDDVVGLTVADLDERLPGGVIVALVGRGGETNVPDPEFTLQKDDHLTLLGRRDAVHEALEMCRGD
ncbi:cation:proton antiporter domain-containing protein [Halocalculus aciditolerans]|uniref:Potassium transporter n=1 Tax=Halocalculus aciditolerans TaxID=1383812 RepID=A0A830F7Z0_9EURY|nr:cation:proton antiporter [Halocalculus aciditolerans]GGL49375.1 potassium transporter [Halocalculus aciditolerans]